MLPISLQTYIDALYVTPIERNRKTYIILIYFFLVPLPYTLFTIQNHLQNVKSNCKSFHCNVCFPARAIESRALFGSMGSCDA